MQNFFPSVMYCIASESRRDNISLMVGCCVLTRIANSSEKNLIEIIAWSPNEYKHINADVNNEISLCLHQVLEAVRDSCLMPKEQFFSCISWREQATFNEMVMMSTLNKITKLS